MIKDKFKKTAEAASSRTKLEILCESQQQENLEMNDLDIKISGLNLTETVFDIEELHDFGRISVLVLNGKLK